MKRIGKKLILFFLLACIIPATLGCGQTTDAQDTGTIHIAIVCRDGMQYDASRFQKGMEMAISEYIGDYKIAVTLHDQSSNFEEALEVDTRLAQDPDVTAVVTLQDYDEIDVAARLMDENNKAYFAVEGYLDSTADKGYDTFFPFCLDAAHLGYAMGNYAGEQGYRRVATIHSGTPFELEQANYFESALLAAGGQTVNSLSEPSTNEELYAIINSMDTLSADAAYLPYYRSYWAVDILRAIRELQPEANILASFTLGSVETVEALEYAEGTVLPAFYPIEKTEEYAAWEQRYEALYGEPPENQAAQGYDILNLVIQNYDGNNARVAQNIRTNAANAQGVAGRITYDLVNGLPDVENEEYYYEYLAIMDGKFVPVK